MRRERILWSTVLIVSLLLLIGYSIWGYALARNSNFTPYSSGFYDNEMMNRWFDSYKDQQKNGNNEKMSIERIKSAAEGYIQGYGDNLVVADIFVFKDTDYYVSIEEKSTGKGAVELLVNPYTGAVYPEYGPNMMWNEKYGMHGGSGYGMMGGSGWSRYYQDKYGSKQIKRQEAVKIGDAYVKKSIGKDYSVLNEGHEFYGYYTFHVNEGDKPVGMLSVNYYTGDIWYHDWHGQLLNIEEQNER